MARRCSFTKNPPPSLHELPRLEILRRTPLAGFPNIVFDRSSSSLPNGIAKEFAFRRVNQRVRRENFGKRWQKAT